MTAKDQKEEDHEKHESQRRKGTADIGEAERLGIKERAIRHRLVFADCMPFSLPFFLLSSFRVFRVFRGPPLLMNP